jgi:hypothetical protein
MDSFIEMLMNRAEHLLQRVDGPLHFRLLIMPLVVSYFAIRAGMRDAGEGQPPFFRTFLTKPVERVRLIRSALKDVGKIFVMAVVLDTTYQLVVTKSFYLGELLFVALVSAILPYFVVRSAVSPLMRRIYRKHPEAAKPAEASKDRRASKPNTDH